MIKLKYKVTNYEKWQMISTNYEKWEESEFRILEKENKKSAYNLLVKHELIPDKYDAYVHIHSRTYT